MEQSFIASMHLLNPTSAFTLGKRRYSFCLLVLHTPSPRPFFIPSKVQNKH